MDLIREFDRVGLRLDLLGVPLMADNPDIYQMDIRKARGGEWYRIWTGSADNKVRVSDADRGRRQLVLLVQEGERAFIERISKHGVTREALRKLMPRGARYVRETEDDYIVERHTTSALRRFLCGMDESHLFIAQFEGGTTVRDAHRQLKPPDVRDAERSHAGRLLRQGEWFFVPLGDGEKRLLTEEVSDRPWIVRRKQSLGSNGHPHVADEVVLLGVSRVYARGAVRHPDHKTLVLDGWRRVHRNAEVRQEAIGTNGIYWID